MWLCCCEQTADDARPPATPPQLESQRSPAWQRLHDSAVVAVDDPAIQRELKDATAEAHRTLPDARQRWSIAKPAERAVWAVKWAAPLAPRVAEAQDLSAGSSPPAKEEDTVAASLPVEHVWVQPVNWSQFRIEGVLLATPAGALECGRSAGEIVSFPIDELSDWIHFASDPSAQSVPTFEGGYTVSVLEKHFGKPPGE
jgi:hypothetical protein